MIRRLTVSLLASGGATGRRGAGVEIHAVTVGFATSGTSAGGGFNTLSGTAANNAITSAPHAITDDGAWGVATSGANTLTLTFSGLDNSLTYTLEVFSVSNTHTAADSPIINGTVGTWGAGFTTAAARYTQTTGATYTGLSTNGSGNLSFAVYDSATRNAIMNGAILTATASASARPRALDLRDAPRRLRSRRRRLAPAPRFNLSPCISAPPLPPGRRAGLFLFPLARTRTIRPRPFGSTYHRVADEKLPVTVHPRPTKRRRSFRHPNPVTTALLP